MEIETVEDRNCWTPRKFLLKGLCTDLLGLTPSELQHGGSRLKGIRDIQRDMNCPASGQELGWGAAFSQTEVLAEVTLPFLSLPPTEPQSWQVGPYLKLHQHCLPNPVIP